MASLPVSSSNEGTRMTMDDNTIDETIMTTISRDLVTIGRNLRTVLIPINWKFTAQEQALRNWDLWGPLIFMLLLASTLSWGEQEASTVFALVFAECALGAIVLTGNVILLGGDIVFFQALCLLGYCLFPICVAAIFCVVFSQHAEQSSAYPATPVCVSKGWLGLHM
ncbi:hypothetical protein FOA52_006480 [Chlamydomonas sp. UWO 241]|nr:hypothetical protein FOA52_006480 [Chlamydomonas sp. UWO 241]